MSSRHTDHDDEGEEPGVPAEVLNGINDIAEGRIGDGCDLDEALDFT